MTITTAQKEDHKDKDDMYISNKEEIRRELPHIHTYRHDRCGERRTQRAPHDGRDVDQSHAAWVTDYRRIVGVNARAARTPQPNDPSERPDEGRVLTPWWERRLLR